MRLEFKQKWLSALRSGDYKQGRKFLRKNNKYCCLGVLCDISEVGYWRDDPTGDMVYSGNSSFLPSNVMKQVGIKNYNPKIPKTVVNKHLKNHNMSTFTQSYGENILLSYLNDKNIPFIVIADIIEETFDDVDENSKHEKFFNKG